MKRIRQINLIVFMIFVIASTSLMYILGIDFFGKQEKPWYLQPSLSEDSLSQNYKKQYLILDKTRLQDIWSDSAKKTVTVLIDAWGVPTEESLMQKEFLQFDVVPHKFAIHQRLANRTKHAELVEFRNNDTTSIYIFGGDSLEYGRSDYIPTLGFNEIRFCQKCNDSTMTIILDSLINTQSHNLIAWTTQDAKTGEPEILQKTFTTILNLAKKHNDTRFIIQGTHRPILGTPETRRSHKSHWVPAVLLNP